MTKKTFQTELRNLVRGELSYRHIRHQIFQSARREGGGEPVPLGDFLRDKLFKLRKGDWYALAFDNKDWRALDRIRSDARGQFDSLYLHLTLDYIEANAACVIEMYTRQSEIAKAVLRDEPETIQAIVTAFDATDGQSLFQFRTVSALISYSATELEKYFRHHLKTDWLHKRFLYPLIYHAINAPVEAQLDNFLSYIVTGKESDSEKATLTFLLRDDVAKHERIGFKAYVALLCHPYDACEILLNHIELELSASFFLPPRLMSALAKLADVVPSPRAKTMYRLAMGSGPTFATEARPHELTDVYGFDEATATLLSAFTSVGKDTPITDTTLPKPLATLARLRIRKYPLPEDFDYLTRLARGWWFCMSGRLLSCLLTSLYMVPRNEHEYEIRDLLRLIGFFGNILPFFLASPSGAVFLLPKFSAFRGGASPSNIESVTDTLIEASSDYSDRMWIKAVQWELRDAERRMQLSRWVQTVRQEIRVAPAFTTGIDWRWIDNVIRQLRLRPFMGNSSGIYVLLLQKIEERDRRSDALRTAVEPIVEGKSLEQFVQWIINEYGKEAIAFARFLLDSDSILMLKLAPNEMAALAARIYALQRCTREFGYTELLPQALFAQEWETLNSKLLLMSVNGGQFEIPWSVFEKDVAAKQHDLYTTVHSLEPTEDMPPILSEAKVTVPYKYRNGKVVIYTYPNRLAPLASLVIGITEDFLDHPGFGLEVILSTRFRHDTMRREFANVITSIAGAAIPTVPQVQCRKIIVEAEKPILDEVDIWLKTYMHSNRPERPHGLFSIIPEQNEMYDVLAVLKPSEGLERVISVVAMWLRERLEKQLPNARTEFESKVSVALADRIESEKDRILELQMFRPNDVERVLSALETALMRRVEELGEWFDVQTSTERQPLPFSDIKMAADGLFEGDKQYRGYHSYFGRLTGNDRRIEPESVRRCFDLLREIFASAVKHSGPHPARVRISHLNTEHGEGFRFSNRAQLNEIGDRDVSGHPYKSLDDVIFREGDSGLAKIASLSASILGRAVTIQVHERHRSFHIDVPFWPPNEA